MFGLCKQCQPWAWEGGHHINLLSHYAPWALESCTRECLVDAVPCALVPKAGGLIECSPITEETPLSRMSHYVAGIRIPPQSRGPEDPITFENFYTALGILTVPTVCDGDCGLDVMNLMLGLPQSFDTREALRAEMSDYFLERMHEQWMLDMLCVAQELDDRDVALYQRYLSRAAIHPTAVAADAPTAVAEAAAVADPTAVSEPPADTAIATMAAEEDQDAVVTEEMLEAMRWASNLNHDPSLLSLIRNLPADIVAEQVAAYRERDKPRKKDEQKIHLTTIRTHQQRMSVCLRFHRYCQSIGVVPYMKMPYGAMKTFIQDNIT